MSPGRASTGFGNTSNPTEFITYPLTETQSTGPRPLARSESLGKRLLPRNFHPTRGYVHRYCTSINHRCRMRIEVDKRIRAVFAFIRIPLCYKAGVPISSRLFVELSATPFACWPAASPGSPMHSDGFASPADCHRRTIRVGSDPGFALSLSLFERRGGGNHWWTCTMCDVSVSVSQEGVLTCIMRSHSIFNQHMRLSLLTLSSFQRTIPATSKNSHVCKLFDAGVTCQLPQDCVADEMRDGMWLQWFMVHPSVD